MRISFFSGIVIVSMILAACQVNNVRDTGGGTVSPTSTVTGVTLDSGTISRVFPGWTQVDSYRIRRSGRTERGFVHTVHPGANCLPGTECQAWNEKPRP